MKKVLIWFITAVILYLLWLFIPFDLYSHFDELYRASLIMEEAIDAISQRRSNQIDPLIDPNRTGLIGEELTELTTTAGDLESKRTTTNPDMAVLISYLLIKIGVKKGDCVAVGASGSFPGLIVATLSACKAIGARPLVICSIGASQWGANQIDFTVLDLFNWLVEIGFERPLLFSYGGSDNKGSEFSEEIRDKLKRKASEYDFVFREGESFEHDLWWFYQVYISNCDERIAAFVNIGGSLINLGRSATAAMQVGLITDKGTLDNESMIGLMINNNVPVLSLLNMKKLTTKYGLLWDPIPLPKASEKRCKNLIKQFVKAR
ncbi:poly-gamma-glutamate system protein [Thermotoga profunda]|uniref:poly-gamma-glutamate system protein n=1 Tax=Thermotoga profunda TaxID=1508420 RepID=UPI000596F781|nr:poly-gamma-glutamate system protein [Thermotoga profunda]